MSMMNGKHTTRAGAIPYILARVYSTNNNNNKFRNVGF